MKISMFDHGASGGLRSRLKLASGALTALALAWTAGPAHAVTYTFQNIIDPLNPTFTQALGINTAGTIVGYGNATIFNRLPANVARQLYPGEFSWRDGWHPGGRDRQRG
jgi:hypothetical protein